MAFVPIRRALLSQPNCGGIDWSNPLTKGLIFAHLPGAPFINQVGNKKASSISSGPIRSVGRKGQTELFNQAYYEEFFDITSAIISGNKLTALSIWKSDSQYLSSDGVRIILSMRSAANAGWSWGRNGAINGGNNGNLTCQTFTLQSVAQYFEANSTIESYIDSVEVLRVDGTVCSFFKDGVKTSPDISVGNEITGNGVLVFGAQGPFFDHYSPWMDHAGVTLLFNIPKTDREIADLSANPRQVFL